MPTVINGIGTWYYGKRHILKRKGTCPFCNGITSLESYDTTLFFVIVFVPIIPLQRKRILDQCASCSKHRLLDLKKWEQAKANDSAALLDQLQADPNNRENILRALGMALAYQDEPFFTRVAESLAVARTSDLPVQDQLAEGYAYFAHWQEAEAALRACLALDNRDDFRARLGWALLKQGRPEEARPYLQHILDQKDQESVGSIYWLINGYQAEGLHEEALALMDERDAAFPSLLATKIYQQQRKTSQKHRASGKKIASNFLNESGNTGYQAGNWTARVPYIIPLVILAGLLIAYLGAALWIGQHRKVFLVNGSDKQQTLAVNGKEHRLSPQQALPIEIPEGEVAVEFRNTSVPIEPVRCRVESSFWSRPFVGKTFVLNPDRLALILREETTYSAIPRDTGGKPDLHIGEVLCTFSGIDYEFTEFPQTVPIKQGQTVSKTRVGQVPMSTPEVRSNIVREFVPKGQQAEYLRRVVDHNPDDMLFLYWLCGILKPEEAISYLTPRLEERPLRVEWHRAYQTLMDRAHPETDLKPRYLQIVTDTKEQAEALYLLGRLQEDEEAEKLFQRAAEAEPPCGHAAIAMCYDSLARADFPGALRWSERAKQLLPANFNAQAIHEDALLANGDFDRLLAEQEKYKLAPGRRLSALLQIVRMATLKGDDAKAKAAQDEALGLVPASDREGRQNLLAVCELTIPTCKNNVDSYLKAVAGHANRESFEAALLQDKLDEAAGKIVPEAPDAVQLHALLYLAAMQANDAKRADTQWQACLDLLGKGDKEERKAAELLSGRKPFDPALLLRMHMKADVKRVILAAAAKHYPMQGAELLILSRKLDYQHDAVSLCLKKFGN